MWTYHDAYPLASVANIVDEPDLLRLPLRGMRGEVGWHRRQRLALPPSLTGRTKCVKGCHDSVDSLTGGGGGRTLVPGAEARDGVESSGQLHRDLLV